MERDLLIELLEEGDKVTLYSPRFVGEEYRLARRTFIYDRN